jgi:RHS repeat-associated protein
MIPTGSPNIYWFGYDPLGRCVKRVVGPSIESGTATYFYYDGGNLIQEGPSATAFDRIYMLGNRVDEIVADYAAANGQWMFHHSEGRGHNMLLTGWNGTLAEQYEYDAFGRPYFFSSTAQPLNSSTFGNRFLFTGREYLSELKLYDYRARMYQPELGRFMSPDPKEFAAGDYNLYRYCHNDPVNKNDPMGLFAGITEGPLKENWIVGLVSLDAKNQRKEVNETQAFYNAVDGFTNVWRQDGKKISAEKIGQTAVDDAKEDAGKVELRAGGRWGVEQATGEYVDGAKLVKKGPEPGLPYKWTPTALIPKWGDKVPLIGTHAHGPQSGMKAELQKLDQVSAEGNFTRGVPYISAVGSSVDNGARIQIYVPHYGFFHSTDGVTFGVGK